MRKTGGRLAVLGVSCGLMALPTAAAGKDNKATPRFAVIGGTVFRDSGLALRNAQVKVALHPETKPAPKGFKEQKGTTDARGEFAIRVPAGVMRYVVSVQASDCRPQEKSVSIQADERVELFFLLEAATENRDGASKVR